jgi:hypothetical protein
MCSKVGFKISSVDTEIISFFYFSQRKETFIMNISSNICVKKKIDFIIIFN